MTKHQTTRRQHFIWQHYLKAWSNPDTDKIFVYIKSKNEVKRINSINIGLQRDFYKFEKLSDIEQELLFNIIDEIASESDKKALKKFVDLIQRIHSLITQFQDNKEFKEKIDLYKHLVIQIGEDLQTDMENTGNPYLDKLRNSDTSFFNNDSDKLKFYQYLAYQYYRTNNLLSKIVAATKNNKFDIDSSKISKYFIHLLSYNLASTLTFSKPTRIEFLKNSTDIYFITIDQPVINLKQEDTDKMGFAKELLLFYPLGPNLALKVFPSDKNYCIHKSVSRKEVIQYNTFMKNNFLDQVYSAKKELLEDLIID